MSYEFNIIFIMTELLSTRIYDFILKFGPTYFINANLMLSFDFSCYDIRLKSARTRRRMTNFLLSLSIVKNCSPEYRL